MPFFPETALRLQRAAFIAAVLCCAAPFSQTAYAQTAEDEEPAAAQQTADGDDTGCVFTDSRGKSYGKTAAAPPPKPQEKPKPPKDTEPVNSISNWASQGPEISTD